MSRIGRKPISVSGDVRVEITGQAVKISGQKGELQFKVPEDIDVAYEGSRIILTNQRPQNSQSRALHGLYRNLLANAVKGVTEGFEKQLAIKGVGYRGVVQGDKLVLNLGFSHPIEYLIPQGIEITVEKNNILKIAGFDRQRVGQTAAEIRNFRPPEPYKGKGIMYIDEKVLRKAGKAVKAVAPTQ